MEEKTITEKELIERIESDEIKQKKLHKELFQDGRRPYKKTMIKIAEVLGVELIEFETTLSKNLKKLIEDKEGNIKQGIINISVITKISKQSLRTYIDSEREPTLNVLERLADYFCVNIDELIRGDISKILIKITDNEKNEVHKIIQQTSSLNAAQKIYFKEYCKII